MAKYHINPKTGRANICNPEKTGVCKYAENGENPPHYDSKNEAKIAYEKQGNKEFGATRTLEKPKSRLKTLRYHSQMLNQEKADEIHQKMHEEYNYIEENGDLSEVNALGAYSISASTEINRYLHGEPMKYHSVEDDSVKYITSAIARLDSIIPKFEKRGEKRTLYRFVIVPEGKTQEEFAKEIAESGEYSDTGFMSTTEDLSYIVGAAHKYKKHKMIVFEIETDRGISLQRDAKESVGAIQSFEKERLLPRDMSFTVEDFGKTTLQVDESRNTLKSQFAGYSHDWQTGERTGYNIPKKTLPIIKLVDKSMSE